MGTYFKPLRRKIGVITLVLACVFMAGWMRSLFIADAIHVYGYFGPLLSTHSEWGAIQVLYWKGEIVQEEFWSTQPTNQSRFNPWITTTGMLTMAGVNVLAEGRGYSVPYWLIVVPLTALSAWLLCWKPRQSRTESTAQPKS